MGFYQDNGNTYLNSGNLRGGYEGGDSPVPMDYGINAPTNSAAWSLPSGNTQNASVTNLLGRGTWIVGVSFTDAVGGAPAFQVSLPGLFTNTIQPILLGVTGVTTNFYSFPVQPNTTNTITDVSGTGASTAVIRSLVVQ